MRKIVSSLAGAALLHITMLTGAARAADAIEQFYGTWVTSYYNNKACKKIDGEVAGIAIYKDKYVPLLGGFCEDVKMFMRGRRLRISANCFSDEAGGHSAITNEVELVGRNTLRVVEGFDRESGANDRYNRCLDCGPNEHDCVFGGGADDQEKIDAEIRLRMQNECRKGERTCEGGCDKC